MPEHVYEKSDLIGRFDAILGRRLEELDTCGLFGRVQDQALQKGVVGTLIEQCVLGYAPDSKQEADLVINDGGEAVRTELKSTGMVIDPSPTPHYAAKEPMSVTAVGIYDLPEQRFETSHFWNKLEHLLLVYYHYAADCPVSAYDYRGFTVKGYELHTFTEEETAALRQDWEAVRDLAAEVLARHPGPRDRQWREDVKADYLQVHGRLRSVLSYIDLAPKFPPRFRLKKPVVSAMIARHFGYALEQLPGRYAAVSDIDRRCRELTERYAGQTVGALARALGLAAAGQRLDQKGIAEKIVIAMFGGTSKKLNQIDLFARFGLIAKTVTVTPAGGRTEDMKLFRADLREMAQTMVAEEDGAMRLATFEDSALYSCFTDHALLCVLFQEPPRRRGQPPAALEENRFLGFKRLVFSEEFIDTAVRRLWEDTRDKLLHDRLEDVVSRDKDGAPRINASGEVRSAPNFLKGSENDVFLRGSAVNSAGSSKTEEANGIRMLPQYVWIRGAAVVRALREAEVL